MAHGHYTGRIVEGNGHNRPTGTASCFRLPGSPADACSTLHAIDRLILQSYHRSPETGREVSHGRHLRGSDRLMFPGRLFRIGRLALLQGLKDLVPQLTFFAQGVCQFNIVHPSYLATLHRL